MKSFLFLILLIISAGASAQQTFVPDNNFEAFLEANAMGNGIPNDDYVTTANISSVTTLGVWSSNIADLTGIEGFASVTNLYIYDNLLSSLDLSQNTSLSDLRCYSNQLTSINVSQNAVLSTLLCYDNQLLSLDVTQNTWLSDLRCNNNSLTSLDVTQNTGLNVLFCYDNFLSSIDVTQNTGLSNFRCFDNSLTSLDVTQNTSLTNLFCYDNNLTAIDVTQNTALDLFFCFDNQLATLDVTHNTALTDLRCNDNQLTSLDVSQNLGLTLLWCYNNQLQCLNANNGQDIMLNCSDNQLTCVSVVYPPWTFANAIFDVGVTFDAFCQFIINNDVIAAGALLTAEQNDATYQWIDCDVVDGGVIIGETNQSYTATVTGYYAVEITYSGGCNGVLIDTSSCHFVYIDETASIDELSIRVPELIMITDLMGRETLYKPNVILIYIYSDGTIERVFTMSE